jgi:CheY-like chemotaxis protein
MRRLVRAILEQEQRYQVLEARDGVQALQLVQQEHPALVILDRQMPGLTGDEVCRELRTHPATQDIPVVIMTADQTDQVQGYMLAAGANAFFQKPFHSETLIATVKQLLGE